MILALGHFLLKEETKTLEETKLNHKSPNPSRSHLLLLLTDKECLQDKRKYARYSQNARAPVVSSYIV